MSLAKVLIMAAGEDAPALDVSDVPGFLGHVLKRVDWRRDLHFHTETTIDTLDYSGSGLNAGSKLVIAAVGPPRRTLPVELPGGLRLPDGYRGPRVCLPGVLAVAGPACTHADDGALQRFCAELSEDDAINAFPLVVLVDDSEFTARTPGNFLWVTFTRMNPAVDVEGIGARTIHKHWGCAGSLVIDARRKPQHAPPLIEDPEVTRRVLALAAPNGPLHGLY
jgi:4-hydroxy-3-polyprenylbenzoate decarboxylase